MEEAIVYQLSRDIGDAIRLRAADAAWLGLRLEAVTLLLVAAGVEDGALIPIVRESVVCDAVVDDVVETARAGETLVPCRTCPRARRRRWSRV